MKKEPLTVTEPTWVKILLICITAGFLALLVLLPLAAIFIEAFSHGSQNYWNSLTEPEMLSAINLTLLVASIVIPLNMFFGVVASWTISKFEFPGKQLLISLIDLPLSVSPVIAGLIFVLIFSTREPIGQWLAGYDIQIIFATPGIVLATLFVTFPYVARELIPLMQQQGTDEEEAAQLLGAKGLNTFFRITLPNIKWGLLYGTLLCAARALGEFGAVSVVSGHIQGLTNTLPLHVEILYNEYKFSAAFAAASILTFTAVISLILKSLIELHTRKGDHENSR
jgi:sulfate transport system permease protein